jgi:hypothetical protein
MPSGCVPILTSFISITTFSACSGCVRPTSGHAAASPNLAMKRAALHSKFDHLGACELRQRDAEVDRVRGFEIDPQRYLSRLLNG